MPPKKAKTKKSSSPASTSRGAGSTLSSDTASKLRTRASVLETPKTEATKPRSSKQSKDAGASLLSSSPSSGLARSARPSSYSSRPPRRTHEYGTELDYDEFSGAVGAYETTSTRPRRPAEDDPIWASISAVEAAKVPFNCASSVFVGGGGTGKTSTQRAIRGLEFQAVRHRF